MNTLMLQPSKSDKEVIRHLYKRYHDVKALLVGMESAAGSSVSTPPVASAPAGAAPTGIAQTYVTDGTQPQGCF